MLRDYINHMLLYILACQHNQKSEDPISSCTQDDEQNIFRRR